MRKNFSILLLFCTLNTWAQDSTYTRKLVDTLTSKKFWGRGYTKNGMLKAGDYIAQEYKNIGLLPFIKDYKQEFSFPVNTFPGRMLIKVNGLQLTPGKDFIVNNKSKGLKFKGEVNRIDSVTFRGNIDLEIQLKNKLTWSVARSVFDSTFIEINKNSFKQEPKTVEIDIENKLIENFKAYNITGFVKGTQHPDSLIIITAHYDHLGGLGKNTYFPGANDNAAGVATLLSLAKYYAQNPQLYSIAFICFAAEEAGLLGSKYFVENPTTPLDKIKFLINLDLVGTGESGMTVVNATVYPKEFELLNNINAEGKLISKINSRGKAANSDHYFFTERGVPAFFFYTQGGPNAYHDIDDRSETLPLTAYNNLFKLIVEFNKEIIKN